MGLVALLSLAIAYGGPFAALALLYITVFTYFMDKIAALAQADHPGQEFPAGDGLAASLGVLHFGLLYGGVWALTRNEALAAWDRVFLFFALSLFLGQVSNSNAHELIHRSPRALRRLGVAVYCSILFGFHASAHVRVHHIHAASAKDPNSAPLGMGFYRFAARAWRGALIEGYRAETRLRGTLRNPYRIYGLAALLSLFIAWVIGGGWGLVALFGLASYAQLQLLLSDYVQHYGLRRAETAAGKLEPVGPQHSWNAPQGFSSALMLNAPRHSDHHAHPSRAYPGLEIDRDAMPILPHSLPVMAVLALLPPLWKRLMDPRARRWATSAEAREA
jgi:alkane 1-monooxygenase